MNTTKPLFNTDYNRSNRLISLFKNHCKKQNIIRCYINRLYFGSVYIPEVEDEIDKVCKIAHTAEEQHWWFNTLT